MSNWELMKKDLRHLRYPACKILTAVSEAVPSGLKLLASILNSPIEISMGSFACMSKKCVGIITRPFVVEKICTLPLSI